MRLAVWFALLAATAAAGCQAPEDDYPNVPGSGPPRPLHPGGDAGSTGPDAEPPGSLLTGRVCVLRDARDLTSCATSGAGGLVVTLGPHTAFTAQDGTFAIERPTGAGHVWRVTGSAIAPSLMPLATAHVLPVLELAIQEELLLDHGVLLAQDRGIAFVHVVRGGQPLPRVIAQVTPPATAPVRYDGVSPAAWTESGTGAFGMVWLAGAPEGTIDVTLAPPVGAPLTVTLPIAAGTATYATIELP